MNQTRAYRDNAVAWQCVGRGALLACAMMCATTGMAYGETLRQVVETALQSHPKVRAVAAQQRATAQDLAQARAGYLPTVDLNLADGKERTDSPQTRATSAATVDLVRREAGLTLSQKLFDGKATSSEIERQTARASVAASRLAEAREEIALKTAEVYLDVLNNRELVKLANDNLREHLRTEEKVRTRVQGGVSHVRRDCGGGALRRRGDRDAAGAQGLPRAACRQGALSERHDHVDPPGVAGGRRKAASMGPAGIRRRLQLPAARPGEADAPRRRASISIISRMPR